MTMSDLSELMSLLDKQGEAFEAFKKRHEELIGAERKDREALEARLNRLNLSGGDGRGSETKDIEIFNAMRRSAHLMKNMPPPSDIDRDTLRSYKSALVMYLRSGNLELLSAEERKSLSVGVDPSGGYLVHPDTSGRIVSRIFEISPIRRIAAVQPCGSDALEGIADTGEYDAGWVSEMGSRDDTDESDIGAYRIPINEMYAMPNATQKLLDDASIDIEAYIGRKIANRLARVESTAFVSGDGVGKPRGFTTYTTAATADASRAWGTLEHVATGSNGSFGTDPNGANKLIDLVHKLKADYRANAVFVMNKATLGAVRKLKDGDSPGRYIFIPSATANMPGTLLGYNVVEDEHMPDYTTTGALAIAFGDFGAGYQIADRFGIRVLRDPYTTKGKVKFYSTQRVGGDVVDFDAIKFLKFSS
jgi:HK97 family phage major capsid protein